MPINYKPRKRHTKKDGKFKDAKDFVDTLSTSATFAYKIAAGFGALVTLGYLLSIHFTPIGMNSAEAIYFIFVAFAFGCLYLLFLTMSAFCTLWLVQLVSLLPAVLRFRRKSTFTRSQCPCCRLVKWKFIRGAVVIGRYSNPVFSLCLRLKNIFARLLSGVTEKIAYISEKNLISRCRKRNSRSHEKRNSQKLKRWRFRFTRIYLRGSAVKEAGLDSFILGCISFAFFLIFSAIIYLAKTSANTPLAVYFVACGFFSLCIWMGTRKGKLTEEKYKKQKLRAGAFALLAPLVIIFSLRVAVPLLNIVFENIGIRKENVSIEIAESEIGTVRRISEALKIPVIDCKKSDSGKFFLHNVDVLWSGIGTHTLISFSKKDKQNTFLQPVNISETYSSSFESKLVRVINAKPALNPCFEIPNDMIFPSGSSELEPGASKAIRAILDQIKISGKISKISVRGHSDPTPVMSLSNGIVDNQQLSEKRAVAVSNILKGLVNDSTVQISSEGAGAREPKVDCSKFISATKNETIQCNKPNRRVEIQFSLKPE